MIIRVDEIKPDGLLLESEVSPSTFPVLAEFASDEVCFDRPIRLSLRAIRVADLLEVYGNVETDVRLVCGRCLSQFTYSLSAHFDMTYSRELPTVEDEEGREIELSADDMGITLFEGDEIDCTNDVQEQVLLALPAHPLCSDECRGICPQCGIDRNRADCACAPKVFNSKFAALKDFKAEK